MLFAGIPVGLLGLGLALIKGFGPAPEETAPVRPAPVRPAFVMPAGFPAAPPQDPIARLERLQALRDAGTLSPAEFERMKAAILAER